MVLSFHQLVVVSLIWSTLETLWGFHRNRKWTLERKNGDLRAKYILLEPLWFVHRLQDQTESAAILKIKESMQEEAKRFETDSDHPDYFIQWRNLPLIWTKTTSAHRHIRSRVHSVDCLERPPTSLTHTHTHTRTHIKETHYTLPSLPFAIDCHPTPLYIRLPSLIP